MSRTIAPRFELALYPADDGKWWIVADLLKPSTRLMLRIEGPYSAANYAALRLRTLIPREIAETMLSLAGAATATGSVTPVHHPTRPT